jgi:hypothetical protein
MLAEILKEDVWKTLHPATKLVVKVLQHIKSKLDDGAEIRAYFDEDEIIVTTYKSEIRITKNNIEFKRRARDSLRVAPLILHPPLFFFLSPSFSGDEGSGALLIVMSRPLI